MAIEVTADVALQEPDPYLAQVYRFGTLEDFDHLYRYWLRGECDERIDEHGDEPDRRRYVAESEGQNV